MNIAKVQKDLKTLSDIVLMQEMKDTSIALQICQQKMNLIQQEMNERVEEHRAVVAGQQPAAPANP
jgi:hypothetical protein